MSTVHSEDVCFNFYIITKNTESVTEINSFQDQKRALLSQLKQLETVFKSNQVRQCPIINVKAEKFTHILWEEAQTYSRPLGQRIDESDQDYHLRRLLEVKNELFEIEKLINQDKEFNKRGFLSLRPGRAIVNTEKLRESFEDKEIQTVITRIKSKLNAVDPKGTILNRERLILRKYEAIDLASAETWQEGVLTLWNDVEAQDVSIEVKNMLRFNRTTENECIDVFSVPKGYSPSSNNQEINDNGEWSQRGGAALTARLFPRTTGGKNTIILTQDIKPNETRLAHELGHILIDVNNAHIGKEPKDLMYEKSMGGKHLSEKECRKIKDSLNKKPSSL